MDVGVGLMLFCEPGLRPCFSRTDDITVVLFLYYPAVSSRLEYLTIIQGTGLFPTIWIG